MVRRRLLLVLVAILWATTPAFAQTPVELSFWHSMGGQREREIRALADGFNASQSRWRVVLDYRGDYDVLLPALLATIEAGAPPHLAQVFEVGATTMLERRAALRPLESLLAAHGQKLQASSFLEPAAAMVADKDGRLTALPFNISTPVLILNQDLFRRAKLDPGQPPRTWPELASAADRLAAAGVPCALVTGWPVWVQLENFLAWHDLPLATHDNGFAGPGAELLLDQEPLLRHLELLREWAISGRLDPDPTAADRRFVAQECAMYTGSSAVAPRLRGLALPFTLAVAGLPYRPEVARAPRNTTIGGAALWALAGHPPEDDAGTAAFLAWLATPERQAAWHIATGYLPVTAEAFGRAIRSSAYRAFPGAMAPIAQLISRPPSPTGRGNRLPAYPQVRAVLERAMREVLTGDAPIATILADARREGNALMRAAEASSAAR